MRCVSPLVCSSIVSALLACAPALAQGPPLHLNGPGATGMFAGTCYQPVDRSPAEIQQDIAIMQHAGFNVVRMGDLSWDSFEPAKGHFTFEWFDKIMDQMQAAGIRVILDIPGSPTPIWLHRAYPGVDLVSQSGTRIPPAERYMDDIADPDYAREATLLAEAMTRRYAHHPALLAIGYNNETGNGFMSYSEADRQRFILWLKAKYITIEALNKAWATQRWSRRLNSFDDVDLPLREGPGPAERYLDLHRFWSGITVARLNELEAVRRRNMPDVAAISNLWDTSSRKGFDYLSTYKDYVSFGAEGFYPGDPVSGAYGAILTKGALPTPMWFNEFTAGGPGYYGTPGRSRMYAHLGALLGVQGILAWTFNSHLGGEEQALFGLVNHDNTPSWKVDEFAHIATDYRELSKYGFPRLTHPQIAIAYSFNSQIASNPNGPSNTTRDYFKPSYTEQMQAAFEPVFRANLDAAILNIGHEALASYKLVIVPADYLMDEPSAAAIRSFVAGGGTVVMTALSAKVDEHAQWFNTPLPGRLSDVFGLKTNAFYSVGEPLTFDLDGHAIDTGAKWYEVLEPSTASVLATFSNTGDHTPAVTANRFGKGTAIYLATASTAPAVGALLEHLLASAGIAPGPKTPAGVFARIVDGRTFYVNTTSTEQRIPITGTHTGLLTHRRYDGVVILAPQGADLLP